MRRMRRDGRWVMRCGMSLTPSRHPPARPAGLAGREDRPGVEDRLTAGWIRRINRRMTREGRHHPPTPFFVTCSSLVTRRRDRWVHLFFVTRRLDRRVQQKGKTASSAGSAKPSAGFAGQTGERGFSDRRPVIRDQERMMVAQGPSLDGRHRGYRLRLEPPWGPLPTKRRRARSTSALNRAGTSSSKLPASAAR